MRLVPEVEETGAFHQPAAHGIRALAAAHFAYCGEEPGIALFEQFAQHLAAKQIAFAVLHRLAAVKDFRLRREGSEEILREGVDRIDPEAATRAIEYPREKRPCPLARVRIALRAQVDELFRQLCVAHAHPAGQHLVDAHGHFRRARLGEGEAQDLRGIGTRLQQQAEHARGQHLRLAGARAGRQPDAFLRVHRVHLVALKRIDLAAHAAPPSASSSASMWGSHSSSRISWS